MKLAGEAGSLLKIEEEIRETVKQAKGEYQKELKRRQNEDGYLPGMAPPSEPTLFDLSISPTMSSGTGRKTTSQMHWSRMRDRRRMGSHFNAVYSPMTWLRGSPL